MKIVYLSRSVIPSRTANSVHVMKMCQAFADNSNIVTLLAPDNEWEYEKNIQDVFEFYGVKKIFNIIKVKTRNLNKIGSLIYSFRTRKSLKKLNPDIVYSRDFFGVFFSILKGFDTILEVHELFYENGFLYKMILKKMVKSKCLKRIVVISAALQELYMNNGFEKYRSKFFIAHDGADPVLDFNSLENWPGRKNVLKVGYFGHLYNGRGIDIIIEIAKKIDTMDFHIIGGNEQDIEYWKSKIDGTNIFFHGYVQPRKVYAYRNSCDILLAPYQNTVSISNNKDTSKYMSPLKIFEYMSNKRAIISSDLPVLREILNEKNAILVKCDDVKEWVDGIRQLENTELRSQISQEAYKDFVMHYSWVNRAKCVIEGNK